LRGHEKCRHLISGETLDEDHEPELPTHVIDVGSSDGSQDPRLVVTGGSRGHYVAVSHCWGMQQPLKTEKRNIGDWLRGIPWISLPKTFQDVITVARALGIQFVWIDSLCIVQDNIDDWLGEAVHMGRIYERARLTIAASHANDSTEGLFFQRNPPRWTQIPYIDKSGTENGIIYVSADCLGECYKDGNETCGPLSQRAWITQEWLLSRRIVFYTKSNLIWQCKMTRRNEQNIDLGKYHNTLMDWRSIVEMHSHRKLTYNSDRLISLEGIRTLMQAESGDEYRFGMWKSGLPRDLYWKPEEHWKPEVKCNRTDNPIRPNVPTWSWASSMTPVTFKGEIYGPGSGTLSSQISVAEFGFEGDDLVIRGGKLVELSSLPQCRFLYFDEHEESDDNWKREQLYCLHIWDEHGYVDDRRFENWSYFLTLRLHISEGTYVRVGYGFFEMYRSDSDPWSDVSCTPFIRIK
jgi:hypothetical protein